MGYLAYKLWGTPFGGTIKVTSTKGSDKKEHTIKKKTGKLSLDKFRIHNIGFNTKKMYFRATGKPYILLRSSKEFYCNGRLTKEARISNNVPLSIRPNKESADSITVEYKSVLRERRTRKR